jgi:2-polyprenyl-3-methyl-5-hydroxy-6-metoxy-1,4-benzoquinol methylase
VIEHVDEPRGFIQSCAQCVGGIEGRPGSLFVSTLNRTTKARLMAVVAAEHILGLVPPGKHADYFTPSSLCSLTFLFFAANRHARLE